MAGKLPRCQSINETSWQHGEGCYSGVRVMPSITGQSKLILLPQNRQDLEQKLKTCASLPSLGIFVTYMCKLCLYHQP